MQNSDIVHGSEIENFEIIECLVLNLVCFAKIRK